MKIRSEYMYIHVYTKRSFDARKSTARRDYIADSAKTVNFD